MPLDDDLTCCDRVESEIDGLKSVLKKKHSTDAPYVSLTNGKLVMQSERDIDLFV